jgi:signal peptidase
MENKRKKDTATRATSSKRKKSKPTKRKKTPKPLKGDSNTIEGIEEAVDQLQNAEKHGEEQIPTKTKEKRGKKLFTPKKLIVTGALIVFTLLLLFFVILPIMQGSMHFLIVLSGSMAPEVNPGDIVISTYINPEEIKINDVITFSYPGNPENCITHRVINITTENGSIGFQTKGDANEDPDQRIAPSSELIGKVVLVIPYLGYLPHFAKSPLGFITLIFIPGVLIIVGEIWKIARIKKKKTEKNKVRRRIRFTTKRKSKEEKNK